MRLTATQVEELYKERLYLSVSTAGNHRARRAGTGAPQGPRHLWRGAGW